MLGRVGKWAGGVGYIFWKDQEMVMTRVCGYLGLGLISTTFWKVGLSSLRDEGMR